MFPETTRTFAQKSHKRTRTTPKSTPMIFSRPTDSTTAHFGAGAAAKVESGALGKHKRNDNIKIVGTFIVGQRGLPRPGQRGWEQRGFPGSE